MKFPIALLLLVSFAVKVYAKDVAMITQLKGNAFVFGSGYSKALKFGSKLQDQVEIMVEDGAVVSVEDYYGHTYHLTGGSHIKFFSNIVELKSGKIWVNSKNHMDKYIVQTANGIANFHKGQFVISYDNYKFKTQLMVMQGEIDFHNVLQPELNVVVASGQFSLVDKKYNQGLPRTPTKVGKESYTQVKLAFHGIDALEKVEFDTTLGEQKMRKPARSIASVVTEDLTTSTQARGKIIFIPKRKPVHRNPASVGGPMEYYQDFLKTAKKPKKVVKKKTPVYIFGELDKPVKITKAPKVVVPASSRRPASVDAFQVVEEINSAFEKSLNKALQQNKRHSDEVNSLIDDLESYDQNYQKNY